VQNDQATTPPLAVFVYGTLKRGQVNHPLFCSGAAAIEPAVTRGRLFHLPAGYPALWTPPEVVLAEATGRLSTDLELQQRWQRRLDGEADEPRPANGSAASLVSGEWIQFHDAALRLPRLDRLEVFRPGRRSLYQRVLIRTWVGEIQVARAAWTYTRHDPEGIPIPSGSWPPAS
jgi:gamma-glutamylcyclotransferase (GGCT)/AIG2-like uncharacterized protein YtfP